MTAQAAYVDSSALVKLVVPEAESDQLRRELARWRRRVSSQLVRVELVRAVARVDPAGVERARSLVSRLDMVRLDAEILDAAARLEPRELRTLDAIHLASALVLGEELDVLVTYDARLAAAAAAAGVAVTAPA